MHLPHVQGASNSNTMFELIASELESSKLRRDQGSYINEMFIGVHQA